MKFDKMDLRSLEIRSGPDPVWDWDRPSKAVLVIGMCGGTVIIHCAGPVFQEYASEVNYSAGDTGLDQYDGEGIYVWEGTLHSSRDWEGDYDCEVVGDIREPTSEEWEDIRNGVCPWNDRDWLRNPCEISDCSYPAEGGYPVCEDHRKAIEGE